MNIIKSNDNLNLTQYKNVRLFLKPLQNYLEVIEQTKSKLVVCSEKETSKLCLSRDPVAVMNIWETLIEAQRNKEFVKFMLTMGRTEEDFRGEITGWTIWKHENFPFNSVQKMLDGNDTGENLDVFKRLVYMPCTKEKLSGCIGDYERETLGKLNPYKSFKTSHSTVARTMRNIESLDLEFVYSPVFTYPEEVSNLYLETTRPDKIDLRLNRCTKELSKELGNLFGGKIALAVNKHTWSSMKPLEPHAHIHTLLLDRVITPDGDKQIIPTYFMNYNERTKRYEESNNSKVIKGLWTCIVKKEFKELDLPYGVGNTLDVHYDFVELKKKDGSENVAGHKKLIHKLKYNRRRPVSDLALYYLFNDFDCKEIDDEFAEHLLNYKNRTQVFGYWNRMSKYIDIETALENSIINVDEETRCPLCYERLVYDGFHEGKELPENVRKVFIDRKGTAWVVKGVG